MTARFGRNRAREAAMSAIGSFGRTVSAALVLLLAGSVHAGGLAIVGTVLSDNGDDDGFADTLETVSLRLLVENTSGIPLTGVSVRLVAEDPAAACVTSPVISIGPLAPGETRLSDGAFVFTVGDLDRAGLGLGPHDALSAAFHVAVDAAPSDPPAHPSQIVLDLDLDVSGGGAPTTFLESFESGTLGTFEVDNMDAGRHSLEASDGYRCQYSDPDWPNSGPAQGPPFYAEQCMLGSSPLQADAVFWGLSGPGVSPHGGRAFSGAYSLYYGVEQELPSDPFTTPPSVLEAAATAEPIHLDYDGISPQLRFVHQVSLHDFRQANLPDWHSYDRGVVMVQPADAAGRPAVPWIKLEPYRNVYTTENHFTFACNFDPVDDGTTEDDFFDPTDPERTHGPSATCAPELTFTWAGETSSPFDPLHVGGVDGPGLAGTLGIGTWVESRFDLGRFRGRSVRLRYLATAIQAGPGYDLWDDLLTDPTPNDDGWWIDDVTVTGALTAPAAVSVDDADNGGLPGPPRDDADGDGVFDVCDNCAGTANADQGDLDLDGLGDACDTCPADPDVVDADGDLLCGAADNCPSDHNPGQVDADLDGYGLPCDCDDESVTTHPGAAEVNDGVDNQCPGDAGHGVADELSGLAGFYDPDDPNVFSWPAQPGAIRYQAARADAADFSAGCVAYPFTTSTSLTDAQPVAPGTVRHYLARATFPHVGSWGMDSTGTERLVPCAMP
jgi:hypothetical protein